MRLSNRSPFSSIRWTFTLWHSTGKYGRGICLDDRRCCSRVLYAKEKRTKWKERKRGCHESKGLKDTLQLEVWLQFAAPDIWCHFLLFLFLSLVCCLLYSLSLTSLTFEISHRNTLTEISVHGFFSFTTAHMRLLLNECRKKGESFFRVSFKENIYRTMQSVPSALLASEGDGDRLCWSSADVRDEGQKLWEYHTRCTHDARTIYIVLKGERYFGRSFLLFLSLTLVTVTCTHIFCLFCESN